LLPDGNISQRWQKSEILLLGGSAGSFKLIFHIIKEFNPSLNKPVIIIIHRKKNFYSDIERLFSEKASIPFKEISDKEKVCENTIYMAPANYHTLIEKDKTFSLDVSDAVWFSKPSIDVTFESVSEVYKDKCTAILFSGANQDGAEGLLKLRNYGALTIVQHPDDAEMTQMPLAAIELKAAEYVMTAAEIFELLKI